MTAFDPKFAREVLERRRDDLNRDASKILYEKYVLISDGELSPFGIKADLYDKRVHTLWDQADSYVEVLAYLDGRILEEMTPAERIWNVLKDWDLNVSQKDWMVRVIEDVIEAQGMIERGEDF